MTELVRLSDILDQAEKQGFGAPRRLRRKLIQFRGYGLVDTYVKKTARRGGEGLWHPIQLELFLCYLRNIKESGTKPGGSYRGDMLQRLASIPIGLWLFGEDGVPLKQAKKCLGFQWAGTLAAIEATVGDPGSAPSRRPIGDKSHLADSARDYVKRISVVPTANQRQGGRLVKLLHEMIMYGTVETVSQAVWADAITDFWAGEPVRDAQHLGNAWRHLIDNTLCGLQHLPVLTRGAEKVDRFWEWAREAYQYANHNWQVTVRAVREESPEHIRDFYEPLFGPLTDEEDLLRAGKELLMFFGFGIKLLRGEMRLREDSRAPRPSPDLAAMFR